MNDYLVSGELLCVLFAISGLGVDVCTAVGYTSKQAVRYNQDGSGALLQCGARR